MRWTPNFFDQVKSRRFVGENAAFARVSVDPFWTLRETTDIYGSSFRGPYRYYTDGTQIEYEIPSIQKVTWNRSKSQDLASCTITIYNSWHNLNAEQQQDLDQFGKKGYFWPKRGQGSSNATWGQTPGMGAYRADIDSWDPNFSWEDVLVEDALIRTYEGYPGVGGDYSCIADDVAAGKLLITGVWIIDRVTAGSDGFLTLSCTDIGRVLVDQIVFPPVVPPAIYPLEYYPPGKSAFDSPWGPKIKDGVYRNEYGTELSTSPASKGEVWIRSLSSSADSDTTVNASASPSVNRHPAIHATDGNINTYALSEAYDLHSGGRPYFEFLPGGSPTIGQGIDSLQLRPWAGGYTVYVSIAEDPDPDNPSSTSVWKGSEDIPGGGIKYVKKFYVPLAIPDGNEAPFDLDFDDVEEEDDPFDRITPNTYYAHKVRLTFENLYYSHIPDGTKRYRAGIRDLILYRNGIETNEFNPVFEELPWTYAMAQHPTRGYWIADSRGNVYGFGDASDYDSTGFGQIDMYGDSTNRVVGLAPHPSGEGYWVVDWMGNVYAQGIATHYGQSTLQAPYVNVNGSAPPKTQVRGIAATYTGNGYWVVYSNGIIRGFGDASPTYAAVPATDVSNFMEWFLNAHYDPGKYVPYNIGLKATAIASSPVSMKFVVTDGSGQVWESNGAGALVAKPGLVNRVYKKGWAGSFKLQNLEWATDIEMTTDGGGYWIAFGSGRVAAFGNATALGKDPYVFESIRMTYEENIIADQFLMDYSFFREILWGLARDPDGEGFWVLKASGEVKGYKADFWGVPGYGNMSGLRWKDGNFNGDWANIVKEILMWGGFVDYEGDLASDVAPGVLGLIESTGIITDTTIPPDKFDKNTLLDVIRELTEVVGYEFRITEEGLPQYASPNWWRAGNFDENGLPIYVNSEGERVESDDPEAEPYIPVVHEAEDMLTYSATLSSTDKRSEIIIGTDLPSAKDPTRTGYVVHTPPQVLATVSGGVNNMRGINRVAIWISQLFENEEERALMAELIGLHNWFAQRTGSVTIVGNPALTIDDQIRLIEQNTSETFVHLINSIDSTLDNETGEYTMSLNTNWLGTADDWVIATEAKESEYIYTVISERVNRWQAGTGRGLTGGGSEDFSLFEVNGAFVNSASPIAIDTMIVIGDSLSYLDSTLDGMTGDRWPNLLEDSGAVVNVSNGAISGATSQSLRDDPIVEPQACDVLVIFLGANDQNISLSGVTVNDYINNLTWFMDNYPADTTLIIFPWPWTGYPESESDPAPTADEYRDFSDAASNLAASRGARFLQMGDVVQDIVAAAGEVGWEDYIVDWIHASALGHELIASAVADRLHVDYGQDNNWYWNGTINTVGVIDNFRVKINIASNLGTNVYLDIYDGGSLLHSFNLPEEGDVINIGSLGAVGQNNTYTYTITGTPLRKGQGTLRLTFSGDNAVKPYIQDSITFLDLVSPPNVGDVPTLPVTPPPGTVGETVFGWSASSITQFNNRLSGGYSEPGVWRHFLGDIPQISTMDVGGGPWAAGVPLHLSFKPNISGPVSNWSSRLEGYLRKGKVAGQITYVTVWHEPENDLDESWMATNENWKRALNEVTTICRRLTAEGTGTFYSVPVMMHWTLDPGSGRDINDWLPVGSVDYDIVGWDIYPTAGGVISALEPPPFSTQDIVDAIDTCEAWSVGRGKPWCIPETGALRYNSEMASEGVASYTSSDRAQWIIDFGTYVNTLDEPPVFLCYFLFGDNNFDVDPELSALNSIIATNP